jgi:hypothetical protein
MKLELNLLFPVSYEAPTIIPDDIIGIQLSETAVFHEVKAKPDGFSEVSEAVEKKRSIDDKDLDAYLLGDADSGKYFIPYL